MPTGGHQDQIRDWFITKLHTRWARWDATEKSTDGDNLKKSLSEAKKNRLFAKNRPGQLFLPL